jgi:hypothetical protein
MSIGSAPGNGIAISLPLNKIVFWSVMAQSTTNQFIQVKDSSGNIVFTAQGASSSGETPTQIGQGFFQAADPSSSYTIWIGTSGGTLWSNVLWTQDVLNIGTTIYAGKYIFSSADSGNAYNDSYIQMQWFQFVG